ncbi:MAG: hypothetical protein HW390_1857 [Candidatus Brocadiaceae bacterium]|nr:hypothetical protein [Candidatus Brocadiaceae bacterium]
MLLKKGFHGGVVGGKKFITLYGNFSIMCLMICRRRVFYIEEVPHETFCLMRQNVSWGTFVLLTYFVYGRKREPICSVFFGRGDKGGAVWAGFESTRSIYVTVSIDSL